MGTVYKGILDWFYCDTYSFSKLVSALHVHELYSSLIKRALKGFSVLLVINELIDLSYLLSY